LKKHHLKIDFFGVCIYDSEFRSTSSDKKKYNIYFGVQKQFFFKLLQLFWFSRVLIIGIKFEINYTWTTFN